MHINKKTDEVDFSTLFTMDLYVTSVANNLHLLPKYNTRFTKCITINNNYNTLIFN